MASVISNTKSVVYRCLHARAREKMAASQDCTHLVLSFICLAAASLLFFSAHSTAFNLKETSYDFRLDITLKHFCSFATVKCEINSRQVTNQLSMQTCRSKGVSIKTNSCLGPGHYSGPSLY